MDDADEICIVVDNGSWKLKGGFSGDGSPRAVFPTVVGRDRSDPSARARVGYETSNHLASLDITCPIEDGVITNWDEMELIWQHLYDHELRVRPEEQPLFITENIISSTNRKKMAEMLFEVFKVPSSAVMTSGLPGLVESGRTTGLVVDCGTDITTFTPIHDCVVIKEGQRTMGVGGSHVTSYLSQLLGRRGYNFLSMSGNWRLDEIKRSHCYFSLAADNLTCDRVAEFTVHDGESISLASERCQAPECLLNPSLIGKDEIGIVGQIQKSIEVCDENVRTELYGNINLVGTSTMFQNMKERVERDLRSISSPQTDIKVIAAPERRSAVWMGGSVLTSLTSSQTMWVTKHQYEEAGVEVLMTDWEPPPGFGENC